MSLTGRATARPLFMPGQATPAVIPERAPPAFAAAWLFSFSVPWEEMILLPREVQLARVLSVVLVVVWMCSTRGGSVRRPDIAHGWMLAFTLWASLSMFWSEDPERTARRLFSYVQLFGIAWVIYQFSVNRTCHFKLLRALVWGEYVLLVGVLASY